MPTFITELLKHRTDAATAQKQLDEANAKAAAIEAHRATILGEGARLNAERDAFQGRMERAAVDAGQLAEKITEKEQALSSEIGTDAIQFVSFVTFNATARDIGSPEAARWRTWEAIGILRNSLALHREFLKSAPATLAAIEARISAFKRANPEVIE